MKCIVIFILVLFSGFLFAFIYVCALVCPDFEKYALGQKPHSVKSVKQKWKYGCILTKRTVPFNNSFLGAGTAYARLTSFSQTEVRQSALQVRDETKNRVKNIL